MSEADKTSIGIASVSTASLGDSNNGVLSALANGGDAALNSGSLAMAQKVIDEAIKQVSQLRGRLGAFGSSPSDPPSAASVSHSRMPRLPRAPSATPTLPKRLRT